MGFNLTLFFGLSIETYLGPGSNPTQIMNIFSSLYFLIFKYGFVTYLYNVSFLRRETFFFKSDPGGDLNRVPLRAISRPSTNRAQYCLTWSDLEI